MQHTLPKPNLKHNSLDLYVIDCPEGWVTSHLLHLFARALGSRYSCTELMPITTAPTPMLQQAEKEGDKIYRESLTTRSASNSYVIVMFTLSADSFACRKCLCKAGMSQQPVMQEPFSFACRLQTAAYDDTCSRHCIDLRSQIHEQCNSHMPALRNQSRRLSSSIWRMQFGGQPSLLPST